MNDVPDHELSDPVLEIAQAFHEAYERLAPAFRYQTRAALRGTTHEAWEQVPVENRALMCATVLELIQQGVIWPRVKALQEAQHVLKAELWGAALDKQDRGGDALTEARRQTARAAIEDWQEAIKR